MKMFSVLQVFLLLAAVSLPPPAACDLYYVRPGSSADGAACPAPGVATSPCLTLQEYVDNSSVFLPSDLSDVQFHFLAGEHSLSGVFTVDGGRNITLKSANASSVWEALDVTVKCQKYSYFQFSEAIAVTIQGIAFHGCGAYYDLTGALVFLAVADLCVKDVTLVDSISGGIVARDLYGTSNITDLVIGLLQLSPNATKSHIAIEIPEYPINNDIQTAHVKIENARLTNEGADIIHIYAANDFDKCRTDSSFTLRNVTTINIDVPDFVVDQFFVNIATDLVLDFPHLDIPVYLDRCQFTSAKNSQAAFIDTLGLISVMNSTFSGYVFGLQIGTLSSDPFPSHQTVLVSNCNFTGNDLSLGPALQIRAKFPASYMDLQTTLRKLRFENNNGTDPFGDRIGIASLYEQSVTIEDIHFSNNSVTPLLLASTTADIFGESYFIGNQAFEGAGIVLVDSSSLVLHNDSVLVFDSNHADNVGGALYVSTDFDGAPIPPYTPASYYHYPPCFIGLHDLQRGLPSNYQQFNISVHFINNTADSGGDILYGGNIDVCRYTEVDWKNTEQFGLALFSEGDIFTYEEVSNTSRWSSAPTRVCLCEDGVPDCLKVLSSVEGIFPGQSFSISLVTVGQRFGVTDGTVYGDIIPQPEQLPSKLNSLQAAQLVRDKKCTTLSYSIQSKNSMEIVALTAHDLPSNKNLNLGYNLGTLMDAKKRYMDKVSMSKNAQILPVLLSTPVYVNLTLRSCPSGFVLSEESSKCVCHPSITRSHLTCDINVGNGIVKRSGQVWLSSRSAFYSTANGSNSSSNQEDVVVSFHCPNGYCNESILNVSLDYPDTQCNFNRTGVLCGGCPPGLSLALGSNRCLSCSNSYIALLIPFAIIGVLLVLVIHVLDLTVTHGTIGGLIFYANVLKSCESLFFLPGQQNVLTVFISWLNLDFGIETCFFDGLDGYAKTWLQFVFPLYLWVLAGLIVFFSRYRRFSKILAGNAVPVLATMCLLSYHKLCRNAITIFSFSTLEAPGNSTLFVWNYDANLSFRDAKVVVLFLTGLVVFLFLWLPFTIVLVFYQWLQRINHKKGCRWVFRLKPFFDANFGPLKDKHLYWVGILLLARAFLLLVFAIASVSNDPEVELLSIAVVATLLNLYSGNFVGQVFKNWYLSLLESSFFVNLVILCVATSLFGSQALIIYTSVSIALLEFIGIVCYHCYKRVSSIIRRRRKKSEYLDLEDTTQFIGERILPPPQNMSLNAEM